MTSSPQRFRPAIATSSRLLQHTASTFLKARDGSPTQQRESLSFRDDGPRLASAGGSPFTSRSGSPGGGAGESASGRTNSPRRRQESYSMHFSGNAMADVFSGSPSRSATPDRIRQHRHPGMRPVESLFGSEPSGQISRSASEVTSARKGLWTQRDGSPKHAYTGSRKHYREVQHVSVTGQTNVASAADVVGYFAGEEKPNSRVMLPKNPGLSGTACNVISAVPQSVRRHRVERFHQPTAPYHHAEQLQGAPPHNASSIASTPPTASPTSANSASILEYREEGWGSGCGSARRRQLAPVVDGRTTSNNSSSLVAASLDPTVAAEPSRASSIRVLGGAPAFIPQQLPQRTSPAHLRRAENPSAGSLLGNIAFGSAASDSALARMPSPVRTGRAAGVYSPYRSRSPIA